MGFWNAGNSFSSRITIEERLHADFKKWYVFAQSLILRGLGGTGNSFRLIHYVLNNLLDFFLLKNIHIEYMQIYMKYYLDFSSFTADGKYRNVSQSAVNLVVSDIVGCFVCNVHRFLNMQRCKYYIWRDAYLNVFFFLKYVELYIMQTKLKQWGYASRQIRRVALYVWRDEISHEETEKTTASQRRTKTLEYPE